MFGVDFAVGHMNQVVWELPPLLSVFSLAFAALLRVVAVGLSGRPLGPADFLSYSDIALSTFLFYVWALSQYFRRNHCAWEATRRYPIEPAIGAVVIVLICISLLTLLVALVLGGTPSILGLLALFAFAYLPIFWFNYHPEAGRRL